MNVGRGNCAQAEFIKLAAVCVGMVLKHGHTHKSKSVWKRFCECELCQHMIVYAFLGR